MNNWEQIESAFGLLEEELGLLEKERAAKAAELAALDGQVSKARLLLGRMGGILTGEAPVAQCPEEHDLQERALQNGHTPPPAPPALATEPCCRIIAVSGQQLLLDPEDYEWAKNHRWYVRAGGAFRTAVTDGVTRSFLLHREVMGNPTGFVLFRNGNRLDCRRHNLFVTAQVATPEQLAHARQRRVEMRHAALSTNGGAADE